MDYSISLPSGIYCRYSTGNEILINEPRLLALSEALEGLGVNTNLLELYASDIFYHQANDSDLFLGIHELHGLVLITNPKLLLQLAPNLTKELSYQEMLGSILDKVKSYDNFIQTKKSGVKWWHKWL